MIQYETFESSSGGEEMSQGIFESEALSFQNRDKKQNSQEKEAKRLERLKRKYKKVDDKVRAAKIDERMKRKRQKRLHLKLEKTRYSEAGEQEDDMLQFKDSDRQSVDSYFKLMRGENKLLDTPTRLLNMSNDFLPHESIEVHPRPGKEQELMTPRKEFKVLKEKLQTLVD